jgi:hypothetical protein
MVHAAYAKIRLTVQYLVYGKLYAVYRGAAATVFGLNIRVYIYLVNVKGIVNGNGVSGGTLRAVGRYNHHIAKLFHNSNKGTYSGCGNTVIIGNKY